MYRQILAQKLCIDGVKNSRLFHHPKKLHIAFTLSPPTRLFWLIEKNKYLFVTVLWEKKVILPIG